MIQSRRYRVVLTPLPVDIEPMPPKIDLYLYFTNSLKKHSSVTTLILFEYKLFLHCAEALKHDKINSICLQMPDAHTHTIKMWVFVRLHHYAQGYYNLLYGT